MSDLSWHYLKWTLNLSILVVGIIALVRFRYIPKQYMPFVVLIWVGSANEIISILLLSSGRYNIYNSMIYDLLELGLMLAFFYRLKTFRAGLRWFYLLAILLPALWIYDSFFLHTTNDFNALFGFIYATVIVFLSLTVINNLVISTGNLLRHPVFLICVGFIIYYTYRIIIDVFWLYGFDYWPAFTSKLFRTHVFINLFCNLIYALAILWIQKKQAFSLQF